MFIDMINIEDMTSFAIHLRATSKHTSHLSGYGYQLLYTFFTDKLNYKKASNGHVIMNSLRPALFSM